MPLVYLLLLTNSCNPAPPKQTFQRSAWLQLQILSLLLIGNMLLENLTLDFTYHPHEDNIWVGRVTCTIFFWWVYTTVPFTQIHRMESHWISILIKLNWRNPKLHHKVEMLYTHKMGSQSTENQFYYHTQKINFTVQCGEQNLFFNKQKVLNAQHCWAFPKFQWEEGKNLLCYYQWDTVGRVIV